MTSSHVVPGISALHLVKGRSPWSAKALCAAGLLTVLSLSACGSPAPTAAGTGGATADAGAKKEEGKGEAKVVVKENGAATNAGIPEVAKPEGGNGGSVLATSAIKVIPEGSSVIAYAELGEAMKTPGFSTGLLGGIGATNPELQKQVMTLVACGIALEGIRSVSFGYDPTSAKGMLAIEGAGVGKVAAMECAATKLGGPGTFEIKDGADGGKELVLSGGDGVGLLLSDDMIVLASKEWADRVRSLAKGEGEAAVDGSMQALAARAGMGPGLSVAAKIPPMMAPTLPVPGVEDVTAHFSTSADMQEITLSFAVGTASEDATTAVTAILKEQYAAFKPALEIYGVPKELADRVAISQEANVTRVDLSIKGPEIMQLMAAASALNGAPATASAVVAPAVVAAP